MCIDDVERLHIVSYMRFFTNCDITLRIQCSEQSLLKDIQYFNAQSKLGLSSFIPTIANLPVPIHMLWPCLHPNQLFFCRPVPRPILIKQRRHCLVPMHGCFLHWQVVNLLLDSVKYIKIIVFLSQ